MSKSKSPLEPSRWEYLKQLQPSLGRFVHVSCEAGMRPADPLWPTGPKVPWVQKPGITYRKPKPEGATEQKEEQAL